MIQKTFIMIMKLDIEITRQDFSNFNFYYFKKKSLLRTSLTGLMGLLIVQYFLNKDKESLNVSMIVISSIIYILLFVVLMYINLSRSKSIPKDNGSLLGTKVYEFSDDHISFSDKDSSGQIQWNAIQSLEEDSKSFYLFLDTIMAILIPKRYFTNKSEEQAFRNFIQSKLNVV